jgi:hypothetical protein
MRADFVRDVEAPVATVWQVVTDLARYPEWNPFVVACRSTLVPGDPITMRVRLFDAFAITQTETLFEHEPGARLCYGLRGAFGGALASERCHVVTALGATRTRYESRFGLVGPLAPVVSKLLGRRLERGFLRMTDAIVRRAEDLASVR